MSASLILGLLGDARSRSSEQVPADGQKLPISAQFTTAGQAIGLEVARTQQQQAIGLIHRVALADNRGMLFALERPQPAKLWMKNVRIPLALVFLRDGEVKQIATNVPPCTTNPCPTYGTEIPVDQMIELRGGRAAELGIKEGHRVTIKFFGAGR